MEDPRRTALFEHRFQDYVKRKYVEYPCLSHTPESRENHKKSDEIEYYIENILDHFKEEERFRAFCAFMRIISERDSFSIYSIKYAGSIFSNMFVTNNPDFEKYCSEPLSGIDVYTHRNHLFYRCEFAFIVHLSKDYNFKDNPIIIYSPEYNRTFTIAGLT